MWVVWLPPRTLDARHTRNGRVVITTRANRATAGCCVPFGTCHEDAMLNEGRMHYEAGGFSSGLASQGERQEEEKKSFVLILPHPAPRVAGSVVDKSRERLCGLGAAAWLPRRARVQSQEPSRPGQWRSWGWERESSHWTVGGVDAICGRPPVRHVVLVARAVIISPPVPSAASLWCTHFGGPRPLLPLTRKRGRQEEVREVLDASGTWTR